MLSRLIELAIRQRYTVLGLALVLAGLGLWSYRHLTIGAVPDITNVQVQINTEAPGYTPLEVEQRVTYPVETALYGLPGLAYTRSLSRYGLSQVTVIFKEGTDLQEARNLIDARLASLKDALPAGLSPTMGPVSTGLGEVVVYTLDAKPDAVTANGQPITSADLREVQDWVITPQLAQVTGVVEINTNGGLAREFHVLPEPQQMLALNITLNDIIEALETGNRNQGAGFIERRGQRLLVRSAGQLNGITGIEKLVIGLRAGVPVTLDQVADVAIGHPLRTGGATHNGHPTVMGTVMMLIGENPQQVAQLAITKLDDIRTSLPDWAELTVVYDRSDLVGRAIDTVKKNLLEGALLVIVILFLLLGNLRAALITAAVIPLSLLMTFTGMVKSDVTANLMSLGALDFGLIVDGAVIIVENCIRRLAIAQRTQGAQLALAARLQETRLATLEVIKPSLFGVFIITVVYLPLFTLDGVAGKTFHPMAITVVMALLSAMLLSLTFVPAAIAVFMRGPIREKENVIMRSFKRAYHPLLLWTLRHRWTVTGGATLLVAASLWLATTLGSVFIPQLDEGDIALHALRINGTSLEQSLQMQTLVEQRILQRPEVKTVYSKIGTPEIATDPMPPNVADTFVMLKPRTAWPDPGKPTAKLIDELRASLGELPGNKYEFTQPIEMRFNELISGVRADVGVKVFGDDLDTLLAAAHAIAAVTSDIRGATGVRVEQVAGLPTLTFTPKRAALAHHGLTVAQVQQVVATLVGGYQAGVIYQGDRRFPLVVRLPDDLRQQLDQLAAFPVATPDGGQVPLSQVAHITIDSAPAQINRENGKRRVVVTTNVRERDAGSFVAELKQRIREDVTTPTGYWLEYDGSFKQMEAAASRLSIVVPVMLIFILWLLVAAFGSVRDGLVIFAGVPFALTGGIVSLWLRDMPLSISAGVGLIALSGVAILNGLVMVSFIRDRWQQTGDLRESVISGALTRLRPVLMTALVASLGFIPMALNTSTGAEVQRPLATVVIGGLISSTLLTLLVLPLLYQWIHQRDEKPGH